MFFCGNTPYESYADNNDSAVKIKHLVYISEYLYSLIVISQTRSHHLHLAGITRRVHVVCLYQL